MKLTKCITLLLGCFLTSGTVTAQKYETDSTLNNMDISVDGIVSEYTTLVSSESTDIYNEQSKQITESDDFYKAKQSNQAPIQMKAFPVIGIRTNILYWAALIPNIGAEWHLTPQFSIQANGAWTHLKSGEETKQYRLYNISAEARYYIGEKRKGYLGAAFNTGQFNLMLKEGEEGKQGDVKFGAGLTGGYILTLNKNFDIDFGLGLGYMNLNYDRYVRENGKFIKLEGDLSKNYFGPTQITIGLVWKIKQVML